MSFPSWQPCTRGWGLPSLVTLRGARGFPLAAGCASHRLLPVLSLSCQSTCPGLRYWWFWHQGCWTSLSLSLDSACYCLELLKVRLQPEIAPEVHHWKKALKKKIISEELQLHWQRSHKEPLVMAGGRPLTDLNGPNQPHLGPHPHLFKTSLSSFFLS